MERRIFLKSATTTEALLTTAGCMSGGSESQPTVDTEAGSETGSSTASETATKAEPAEVPSPELTLHTNSDVLRVVHVGGEKITDEGTDEVYVTIDDGRTAMQIADGDKDGEFPVSVGNFLEIESTESDSTVEVVQVGSKGAEKVLATREVGAKETTTTAITNEIATNETTTNETATSETTMTMTTETTTSSGNETNN